MTSIMEHEHENNKNILNIILIIILIMAALSLAGVIFFRVQPVILQGEIQSTTITISGKLPGRISRFYIKEGAHVNAGDTLVCINSPEAAAELLSATAMENAARYQNLKVDSGTRPEIVKSLEQAWIAAQANYRLAQATYKRTENLFLDSIATSQKMDEVTALYKSAEAAMNAARLQYEMAVAGAQSEDKMSSRAMVEAAKGGVLALESLLADTHLISPSSGEVSSIYPTAGELVMTGTPIMDIAVTDSCYAVLNIREDLLPHFGMGEKFKGKVPALGDKELWFQIFYISPLGSFANWHASRGYTSYNIVTFQIKASPLEQAGLRPGMSVLVELGE